MALVLKSHATSSPVVGSCLLMKLIQRCASFAHHTLLWPLNQSSPVNLSFHTSTLIRKQNFETARPSNLSVNKRKQLKRLEIKKRIEATKISKINQENMDQEAEKILEPLRAAVKEQGDLVRQLKSDKAGEIDVKVAVAELKKRKKLLEDKELALAPKEASFDRLKMENLLKQRFFYDQSFSIYGGVTGLYDYGPMGCAMKANLLTAWRKHFVLEEQMLEVACSMLTPEMVLKASGHVERFQDYMVKDLKTGECFRADHLIEATFEKILSLKDTKDETKARINSLLPMIDGMSKDDMGEALKEFNMKSPVTGNDLSEPLDFNLMFSTSIGPTGHLKGFLRPETAQGIFVNFKRLLEFNAGKLPFAGAQIGDSFRNEISPRSGLLRVREFTMAEIEHFCDPSDKSHPKFSSVAEQELMLYSACNQMDGKPPQKTKIGEAVKSGLVANETLGYFMARISSFLIKMGVDPAKLRFRQHLSNEMAHYAKDCWDAECKTSYGWIECVGCADRSCYDLTQHANATGVKLVAEKKLPAPVTKDITECVPEKGLMGKAFKGDSKIIMEKLSALTTDDVIALEEKMNADGSAQFDINGKQVDIKKEMVKFNKYQKTFHVEEIVPSVIEPSFGIGRVMYAVFEHNFKQRDEDEQRTFFSIPPVIAPYKCSVLPLSQKDDFKPLVASLSSALTAADVSHRIEEGAGSIGRRYTRCDAIAIPFGITVDFDSLKEPHTATLRERDTMKQIRAPVSELPELVKSLADGRRTWENVLNNYPLFEQQETKS